MITEGKQIKYKLPTGPPVNSKCEFCERPFLIGGPFWLAPIHDPSFVERLLASVTAEPSKFGTVDRMIGMLSVVSEELPEVPFYYDQDRLHSLVKGGSAKFDVIRSAFLNGGYKVSLSHANKKALKTDAPNAFVWKVMNAWVAQDSRTPPIDFPEDTVTHKLRKITDPEGTISFELHPEANPESRSSNLKRFQPNPEPNWGPKMRAHTSQADLDKKRKQNQGKYSSKKAKVDD